MFSLKFGRYRLPFISEIAIYLLGYDMFEEGVGSTGEWIKVLGTFLKENWIEWRKARKVYFLGIEIYCR